MTKIKRVLGIHVIGGFLWYLYVPKRKEKSYTKSHKGEAQK